MRTIPFFATLALSVVLLFQASSEAPALRRPADYRQLIASYISARNKHVVRDAKITKPYERWGGLLKGGTMTAVCVAVFRDNPFGIVVRDNWVFRLENGDIQRIELGMESCSDLSPFPELMQEISAPRPGSGSR